MNIIFGKQHCPPELDQRHIVLELDTLKFEPSGITQTVYCVMEQVPIDAMDAVPSMRSLHENLLINYRNRNWDYCEQALEHLQGFWGPDMDSFYQEFADRIAQLRTSALLSDWDGHLIRADPELKINTAYLE
jgi:hypothetical protein